MRSALRRGLPWNELANQLHEMGNQSLLVVASGLGCFGSAMVAHADHEAKPIVQDIAVVGPPYFHLLVREFSPVIVGALAALKIGSRVAAELGTMTQTEQVEALLMASGDADAELVAPRVLAGVLTLPVLLTVGLLLAATSASLTATYAYGSDGRAWLDPLLTSRVDVALAYFKSLLFGITIPLAGAVNGLRARGGASAVGVATTQGAVDALIGVLFIDVAMAALATAFGL
jgi:phospholipid/cholesterol/gamma-HCH transport system permease protein